MHDTIFHFLHSFLRLATTSGQSSSLEDIRLPKYFKDPLVFMVWPYSSNTVLATYLAASASSFCLFPLFACLCERMEDIQSLSRYKHCTPIATRVGNIDLYQGDNGVFYMAVHKARLGVGLDFCSLSSPLNLTLNQVYYIGGINVIITQHIDKWSFRSDRDIVITVLVVYIGTQGSCRQIFCTIQVLYAMLLMLLVLLAFASHPPLIRSV